MRLHRTLLAAAMVLPVAACGSSDSSDSGSLDVAVIPYSGLAAMHLGIEQGIMEDHDLELNIVEAEAPPAVVSQVISGQADLGYVTTFSVVAAVAEGADLKIVAPVEGTIAPDVSATEIIVPADSDIQDVTDLEGKKHGVVALNSAHDLLTREVVERAGGDPSTMEMVQVPFPQMATSLQSGDVDAVTITEPFRTLALQSGDYRSISQPDAEVLPGGTATVWFASGKFLDDEGDVAEDFHQAMCESILYGKDHPEQIREVIPTFTELEPELANEITISAVPDPEINVESLQVTADLMKKFGVIDEVPALDDIVVSPTCP